MTVKISLYLHGKQEAICLDLPIQADSESLLQFRKKLLDSENITLMSSSGDVLWVDTSALVAFQLTTAQGSA